MHSVHPLLLSSFSSPPLYVLLSSLNMLAAAEKTETTEQLLAKPPTFSVRIDKRKNLGELKEELERRLDCEAKSFKVSSMKERAGSNIHHLNVSAFCFIASTCVCIPCHVSFLHLSLLYIRLCCSSFSLAVYSIPHLVVIPLSPPAIHTNPWSCYIHTYIHFLSFGSSHLFPTPMIQMYRIYGNSQEFEMYRLQDSLQSNPDSIKVNALYQQTQCTHPSPLCMLLLVDLFPLVTSCVSPPTPCVCMQPCTVISRRSCMYVQCNRLSETRSALQNIMPEWTP